MFYFDFSFSLGLQIKNCLFAKLCLLKYRRLSERYQSPDKSIYYHKTFKGQFFEASNLTASFDQKRKITGTESCAHIKCFITLNNKFYAQVLKNMH